MGFSLFTNILQIRLNWATFCSWSQVSLFKQQTQLRGRAASCRHLRADWESLTKNNKNMLFKSWIFKKILRKLDYLNIMSSGSPNESTASRLERIGRRSDANDRQEIDSDFVEENIGKFYFQWCNFKIFFVHSQKVSFACLVHILVFFIKTKCDCPLIGLQFLRYNEIIYFAIFEFVIHFHVWDWNWLIRLSSGSYPANLMHVTSVYLHSIDKKSKHTVRTLWYILLIGWVQSSTCTKSVVCTRWYW